MKEQVDISDIKLEDCKLITLTEYSKLKDPIFVGQTRLDSKHNYYMVWSSNGVLYKTFNEL